MAQSLEAVFSHGNDQLRRDHTPDGADVVNGQIVDTGSGNLAGICTDTEGIEDGRMGALATAGVFRVKKDDGAAVAFAVDDKVDWDATARLAVAGGAGDFELGVCVDREAVATDDGVMVDINRN